MNVLQRIVNGIAECPILIESDHQALMTFSDMAKKNGYKHDSDHLSTHDDKAVSDFVDEVYEHFEHTGIELRWWDTGIEESMFNEENGEEN